MVTVGTSKVGGKYIKRDYPNEDGLTAGTTTQEGHKTRLEAQEGSTITKKDKVGLE
jgi:hypothetical protein